MVATNDGGRSTWQSSEKSRLLDRKHQSPLGMLLDNTKSCHPFRLPSSHRGQKSRQSSVSLSSVSLAWSSPHSAYKPTLCLCLGKSNSSAYFAYDGSFKVVKHPKGSKSPLNTLALAVCSQLVPTNHNEWNGRIKTGACVSRGLPYTDTQRTRE
jgi:hypothetical protein